MHRCSSGACAERPLGSDHITFVAQDDATDANGSDASATWPVPKDAEYSRATLRPGVRQPERTAYHDHDAYHEDGEEFEQWSDPRRDPPAAALGQSMFEASFGAGWETDSSGDSTEDD